MCMSMFWLVFTILTTDFDGSISGKNHKMVGFSFLSKCSMASIYLEPYCKSFLVVLSSCLSVLSQEPPHLFRWNTVHACPMQKRNDQNSWRGGRGSRSFFVCFSFLAHPASNLVLESLLASLQYRGSPWRNDGDQPPPASSNERTKAEVILHWPVGVVFNTIPYHYFTYR